MSMTVAEYSGNKDVVMKGVTVMPCYVRPDKCHCRPSDVWRNPWTLFRKPIGHNFIISHQIGTFAKLRNAGDKRLSASSCPSDHLSVKISAPQWADFHDI
jgi:hypothetical protein